MLQNHYRFAGFGRFGQLRFDPVELFGAVTAVVAVPAFLRVLFGDQTGVSVRFGTAGRPGVKADFIGVQCQKAPVAEPEGVIGCRHAEPDRYVPFVTVAHFKIVIAQDAVERHLQLFQFLQDRRIILPAVVDQIAEVDGEIHPFAVQRFDGLGQQFPGPAVVPAGQFLMLRTVLDIGKGGEADRRRLGYAAATAR